MGKGRKYIQMDDSLLVFMPLCRLSVQLLRIYMHNLELFFVFPGPRQLHFPIILQKQQQISLGWAGVLVGRKELNILFLNTSHYLHSALLWRKELHCCGSWLSFDMDSRVERICLNIGLSWKTTAGGQPSVVDMKSRVEVSEMPPLFHSLLAPSSSRSSRARQSWRDSRWGWWAAETNTHL